MVVLFETLRLAVRQVTPDDIDGVLSIFGDPENVGQHGIGQPWSRAEAERYIASYPAADPRLWCDHLGWRS